MTTLLPTIHVVDDDVSFSKAVGRLLRVSGYQVALYGSGDQFLKTPPPPGPGCILLDVHMSGVSGLQLQEQLTKLKVMLPIVFLTGHGDIPTSVRAIKAGAEDFLSKPVTKTTLISTVERALGRYRQEQEHHARLNALRALVESFTPREREVFALVVRGRLNKQIAFELGTSERTVKAHRHNIMQKLQVHSLAEAVSIAERIGMVAEPDEGHRRTPSPQS